jgi:hypothetical protein
VWTMSALRRTLDGRRVSGAPTELLRAAGLRTTIGAAAIHGFLVGPQGDIAGRAPPKAEPMGGVCDRQAVIASKRRAFPLPLLASHCRINCANRQKGKPAIVGG